MFPSTKGFYNEVPCICPEGLAHCNLPNCLFSHSTHHDQQAAPQVSSATTPSFVDRQQPDAAATTKHQTSPDQTDSRKRRKLEGDSMDQRSVKPLVLASGPLPSVGSSSKHTLMTETKPVSPPSRGAPSAQVDPRDEYPPMSEEVKEFVALQARRRHELKLNPISMGHAPEGHGLRLKLLKALYASYKTLNDGLKNNSDPEIKALQVSDQTLIKWALDEEYGFASGSQKSVYKNVIKLRITALRKMQLGDWVTQRKSLDDNASAGDVGSPPITMADIEMTPAEEVKLLTDKFSRCIASPEQCSKYGYTVSVPTEEDIGKARRGVEAANCWEICNRCGCRFQAFPDRREDGSLTTGGKCVYHHGKKVSQPVTKFSSLMPSNEMRWSCCQDVIGSEGCTSAATHVFKISEAKRLALIEPFIQTPPNPNAPGGRAVCFDCEMGYTAYGLELIRLTATSWPLGECILDVLVRPRGAVLDLNTRFSGVTGDQFSSAPSYTPSAPQDLTDSANLVIVESLTEARALFLGLITTTTPLIGHGLENDLHALRLCHPTIVDTAFVFPHSRGLPFRNSLKGLARLHLEKDIQMGGAEGHDSLEDARAAGELVRLYIHKRLVKK
ncbi:hypothetical protein EJ05DRAFT_486665 [Pseudovirgaria hyperparasitica]|uniref:Exonuclease domain-containing protein n=1 Tax=Pseudovirgaria hyperparasitica TaxID=470096 RepID=A0A6A6W439_9PEZI|nr:uncharacterized protein EJ05DRAFT_486665 [Pseudovirgaria hyperparasitica]KAF2757632.1 hypothetical protein EJ05DRAFT_486665 [Pseudovirgaria hyperparasitica]